MLCPALGAPRTLQDSAEKGARSHSWVTNHVQGLDCDGILGAIVVALWQRWTHQAADVLLSNARRGWQRAGILGPHTSAQSRDPEAGTPISLEPGGYIGEGTRKSSSRYMAGMVTGQQTGGQEQQAGALVTHSKSHGAAQQFAER
jgi:hypothetical protein